MKRFPSVRKNSEFQKIYKSGTSYANRLLVMYVAESGEDRNRIGISVSKKVGNSVVRHHITRLIREIFRLNDHRLKTGLNLSLIHIFSLERRRVISEKSLASSAIFPCSRISPSTFVSIPSSISLPVSLISPVLASIRIHSRMDMVVLEGTAFITILMPFTMASF